MRTHFFWVLATLIITACNNKQKENDNTASDDSKIWNELPTVAAEVKTNGTTLMVCDWTAVKDSIHLPLSYFIEDLDIVKLDNKDEALVRNSSVTVSDNYILIHCSQNIPFKLFDLKLGVDISKAMQTDEVTDTVNYAEVYNVIKTEMDISSKLLEHVGKRIVKKLFKQFATIEDIDLFLSKRNPPMGADIESAGIELHCSRK